MRRILTKPPSSMVMAAALLGLVIAIGATRIANFDIWWHLKTGSLIWQSGEIPRQDPFSYTMAGAPWFNHEWLFQIAVWLLYSAWGVATLTALKLAATVGMAYATFRSIQLFTSSPGAALWGTFLLLWSLADRIMARPFIITLLLTAVFCLQLHRFAAGRKKNLWEFIPLTLIWINCHGAGLFAPMIVLAYALGESIQAYLDGPEPIPAVRRRHLWIVGLLTLVACLATPLGAMTFIFPLKHLQMGTILSRTQEWLPILDPRLDLLVSQIIFRITLVATLISYIINRRGTRMSHLLLTALTCFMVLRGQRFGSHFMIVNLPIMFFNLKAWLLRFKAGPMASWGHTIAVATVSLCAVTFGVPLAVKGEWSKRMGFGAMVQFAPAPMVNFLEEYNIGGRVFNDMAIGSYLIFRRWPQERVFIDGRTPVYGDEFYRRYIEAFHRAVNFERLDQEYRFDYLVFKAKDAWDIRHVHKYLWKHPTWRLVYMNCDGIVYLRQGPRFAKLIKELELKRNPLMEEMEKEEKSKPALPRPSS
jgi:hypothetical protein